MKNYIQYMKEAMATMPGFNIPRNSMPQINDIEGFKEELDKLGIRYFEEVIQDLSSVRPTQVDYDEAKVSDIVGTMKTDSDKIADSLPIVTSRSEGQSDFVVDGHHRYYAALQVGAKLNSLVVDMPLSQLLALSNVYAFQQATDSVDSDVSV